MQPCGNVDLRTKPHVGLYNEDLSVIVGLGPYRKCEVFMENPSGKCRLVPKEDVGHGGNVVMWTKLTVG